MSRHHLVKKGDILMIGPAGLAAGWWSSGRVPVPRLGGCGLDPLPSWTTVKMVSMVPSSACHWVLGFSLEGVRLPNRL